MYSAWNDGILLPPGFPIRTPPVQRLLSGSPRLFAAIRVLHRRLVPRHPPYALISLTRRILFAFENLSVFRLSALFKLLLPSYEIVKDHFTAFTSLLLRSLVVGFCLPVGSFLFLLPANKQ